MDQNIRNYLSAIGEKGGCKSRRALTPRQAKAMVNVREARKAYHKFYVECFRSCKPDFEITVNNVKWVGEQLMKYGNREAWILGSRLCR
jgi:hypothetical protein